MLCLLALAGCETAAAPKDKDKPGTEPKLAGVYPDKFECSSIVTNVSRSAHARPYTACSCFPIVS